MGLEDLIVADHNREAVLWIDQWQEAWHNGIFVLSGEQGSGKTHMAHVWQNMSRARFVAPHDLAGDGWMAVLSQPGNLIIDGCDPLIGNEAGETALFHLYNAIAESPGRFMMLTMEKSPIATGFMLKPDHLGSRLRSSPGAIIRAPDDDLLVALMKKRFEERGHAFNPAVLTYAVRHMTRSFAGAADMVDQAITIAEGERVPVTRGVIKRVLTAGARAGG